MPRSTDVLSIRVSQSERELLGMAAQQAGTNLSDYVRRRAVDGAELDLLDRRTALIASADWEAFETWAQQPPHAIGALQALAQSSASWPD